jgi:queuosine precursor transporter
MKIVKFDVLVALYVFGIMVAELMGAKTFPLFNIGDFTLNASVAIFVMPLLFTVTDIIAEVKGRERARSIVFSGLITVFLVLLFALLATSLAPSARFAGQESAYDAVFGASARIAFASIVAFAVAELLDVAIFSKLRQKMKGRALWFRNNASNFVSQLVDSAVFVTIAFYAFGASLGTNVPFLLGIILPYWILRCILSAMETPLVYLGVRWLRGKKVASPVLVKENA